MKLSLLVLAAELVSAFPQYSFRRSLTYYDGAFNGRDLFERNTIRHYSRGLDELDNEKLFARGRIPIAPINPIKPVAASNINQAPIANKKSAVPISRSGKVQSNKLPQSQPASNARPLNVANERSSSVPVRTTRQIPEGYSTSIAGFREYATSPDGKVQWSRPRGNPIAEWTLKFDRRKDTQQPQQHGGHSQGQEEWSLAVVRQMQGEGQPLHWSLFVHQEGSKDGGEVFQVKGDATAMKHFHPSKPVNLPASGSFKDHIPLARINAAGKESIRKWANTEPPPRADTQADVRENCQGWTLRVVKHLIDDGVVPKEKYNELVAMMDTVNRR